MKILVLGKNGMLGHVVFTYFQEKGYEVEGTVTHGEGILYDANTNMDHIENIILDLKPNVIINCIGILNKIAESNKTLAIKLNSLLPHYINELSQKYNFKFIHVSTDCVFEGTKGKYTESSFPDATSFYGRSKALGEIRNDRNVTLRTSIVGPDNNPKGIGLFEWFITQKDLVYGYSRVIWTGVTTIQLAKAMEKAIKKDLTGLHHVVNNEFISKKDLLELFKKYFNKTIQIIENEQIISEKTLIRTDQSFNFNIPSYNQMVKEMKEWVTKHKDLYPIIIENCNVEGIAR